LTKFSVAGTTGDTETDLVLMKFTTAGSHERVDVGCSGPYHAGRRRGDDEEEEGR